MLHGTVDNNHFARYIAWNSPSLLYSRMTFASNKTHEKLIEARKIIAVAEDQTCYQQDVNSIPWPVSRRGTPLTEWVMEAHSLGEFYHYKTSLPQLDQFLCVLFVTNFPFSMNSLENMVHYSSRYPLRETQQNTGDTCFFFFVTTYFSWNSSSICSHMTTMCNKTHKILIHSSSRLSADVHPYTV